VREIAYAYSAEVLMTWRVHAAYRPAMVCEEVCGNEPPSEGGPHLGIPGAWQWVIEQAEA